MNKRLSEWSSLILVAVVASLLTNAALYYFKGDPACKFERQYERN